MSTTALPRYATQADTLREGRQRAALTQSQAAEKCGIKLDTWRSWEHGRRRVPDELRSQIVKDLGLPAGSLPYCCPRCGRAF